MSHREGFTLIELLVVVAIIGVLASVVLSALNTARGKGADSAIKANLSNMRAQAELLYDSFGFYAVDTTPTYFALAACNNTPDTMFSNSVIWGQVQAAANAGNGLSASRCVTSGAGWAVAVQLKTSDGSTGPLPDSWCVDANGASKAYTWTTGQTIANSITGVTCN